MNSEGRITKIEKTLGELGASTDAVEREVAEIIESVPWLFETLRKWPELRETAIRVLRETVANPPTNISNPNWRQWGPAMSAVTLRNEVNGGEVSEAITDAIVATKSPEEQAYRAKNKEWLKILRCDDVEGRAHWEWMKEHPQESAADLEDLHNRSGAVPESRDPRYAAWNRERKAWIEREGLEGLRRPPESTEPWFPERQRK